MITTKLYTKGASSSALAIVAITFVLAGAIVAVGRQPDPQAVPTPALRLPIVVIQKEREIQIKYVVATPTAQPAEPAPVAAPAPASAPAPTAWVADPQIVQSGDSSTVQIEVP